MSDHTNWYCAQCGSSEPGLHYPLCPELKKIVNESKTHAAEVERLNNRIADLELELEQENASSRVYMDKTDAEIAALTKALDEATSRVVTIDKATDAYVRKHGNFTVVHDYERLSPASRALCERLFGGTK